MQALRSGDWVMVGKPNCWSYILSGVWQPGRHFYWPWNFIPRNVPLSSLMPPPGWEIIKFPLGQRIFLP